MNHPRPREYFRLGHAVRLPCLCRGTLSADIDFLEPNMRWLAKARSAVSLCVEGSFTSTGRVFIYAKSRCLHLPEWTGHTCGGNGVHHDGS
jgi:hypothetical protein